MGDVEENCENKMAVRNPGVRETRALLAHKILRGHFFPPGFVTHARTCHALLAKERGTTHNLTLYQREAREFLKVMSVPTMFHYKVLSLCLSTEN